MNTDRTVVNAIEWTGDNFGQIGELGPDVYGPYGKENAYLEVKNADGRSRVEIGDLVVLYSDGSLAAAKKSLLQAGFMHVEQAKDAGKVQYDSLSDTLNHIQTVQGLLVIISENLYQRRLVHDNSKLMDPEKSMYDKFTPMLAGLTYGSDEYKKCLVDMGPALQHHYQENTHHPEHWPVPEHQGIDELDALIRHTEGTDPENPALPWLRAQLSQLQSQVNGMSLLDIIEMLADWKAAGMRHNNGNMAKSLEINRKRFGLSPQLFEIMVNTCKELGW